MSGVSLTFVTRVTIYCPYIEEEILRDQIFSIPQNLTTYAIINVEEL